MESSRPFIDIHTHKNQTNSGIAVVNIILANEFEKEGSPSFLSLKESQSPLIYFSIGIHPWFLSDWESQYKLLEELACHPKVIAIGECGLDKTAETPLDKQKDIFNQQIILSEKSQKPLIIHCVKAYNELVNARKTFKPRMPWIIHGFNNSLLMAKQCIECGMCISLGKSILNNNLKTNDLIKQIPISQLFLETDEINLPIEYIYRKYAEAKEISMDQLKFAILQNFNNYFKF